MSLAKYVLALGIAAASLYLPMTVDAQSIVMDSCEPALFAARDELNDVPNVSVTFFDMRDVTDQYRNSPVGRPIEVIFGMSGTDGQGQSADQPVYDVLTSPVLMSNIAANIFEGCTATGMIAFGVDGTGVRSVWGWTPSGPLAFDCAAEGKLGPYDWGEMYCNRHL